MTLLVGEAEKEGALAEQTRSIFRMTTAEAFELTHEILASFSAGKKKPGKRILSEAIRVLFTVKLVTKAFLFHLTDFLFCNLLDWSIRLQRNV